MEEVLQIAGKKRTAEAVTVEVLKNKKTSDPLMLSQDLDKQVQSHLAALRESGAVVNTAIAIASVMGVVKSHDIHLEDSVQRTLLTHLVVTVPANCIDRL